MSKPMNSMNASKSLLWPAGWLLLIALLPAYLPAQQNAPDTATETSSSPAPALPAMADILEQGLVFYQRGEREQAFVEFDKLIDAYNSRSELSAPDLYAAATAARYLGVTDPQLYKDAVRVYQEAIERDPDYMQARVALGDLLLEKYNNSEAANVFNEALRIDAGHPEALLGLARSQNFDHSPEALETTLKVLERAPDLVDAHTFLARLYIELEQYGDAELAALTALELDGESLPALAVLATVYYLIGDDVGAAQTIVRIFDLNPFYAELYNTLSELAARNRLYADALRFAGQAVELDPQSWRGWGLLGTNQLRLGAIEDGIASLNKSFEGDPYNVWIKNMLDLSDTFDEYDVINSGPFQLVLHQSESQLLTPYVLDLAEQAYDYYTQRYDFEPTLPIRIEFYPRHADFSVRTVGLAGIGLLGVAFGSVVAMDSPSAREIGGFNWGSTLWHEIAHTFHLGMTDNRVPRWFSEGLAVHEEHQALAGWGGDVTVDFLEAFREDKLLPVSELNNGFVRPSYPEQIIHSYYQASLVFDFIERTWGFEVIKQMLHDFKQRRSTEEAIQAALNMDMATFDQAFDLYFRNRFVRSANALAPLRRMMEIPGTPEDVVLRASWEQDSYMLQMQAGHILLENQEYDRAEAFLLRAAELVPENAAGDSPYRLLADLYEKRGETARAAEMLRQMTAINGEHYHAHIKLAELLRQLDDKAGAADALQRANYIYPAEITLHQQLADLYGDLDEWQLAARERRAVVALQPVDMAEARYQLANAYYHGNDLNAARMEILQALEIAPNFEQGLELLLQIREQRGSDQPEPIGVSG